MKAEERAPMSREHTSMKRILICIVAALLPAISHAKLIGEDRDEFVEGVYQSCYQENDAREKGYSLPDLARFCDCFSNALADRISPEQAELFDQRPDLTILRPLADDAASVCRRFLDDNN
jgi:hypothetical protein